VNKPIENCFFLFSDSNSSDYYSYGMLEHVRSFSYENYKFGFNGKEKDDEVKGTGVQIDYGFRIFDSRVGRFLSVDPLFQTYAYYTPYQYAGNDPILFIDVDGFERHLNKNASKQIRCFNDWDIKRINFNLGINLSQLFHKKPEFGEPSFGRIRALDSKPLKPLEVEGVGTIPSPEREEKIQPIAINPKALPFPPPGNDKTPDDDGQGGLAPHMGVFDGVTLKKNTTAVLNPDLSQAGMRTWNSQLPDDTKNYFLGLSKQLKGTGITDISIRLTVYDSQGTAHATNTVVGGDPGDETYGNDLSIYDALVKQGKQAALLIEKNNPGVKVNVSVDIVTSNESKNGWQITVNK